MTVTELAEALRAVRKLIEDGDLVRNIDNDKDFSLYLAQAQRITEALSKAQKALEES